MDRAGAEARLHSGPARGSVGLRWEQCAPVVGDRGQTKALSPVTALPTMSVFISRVPSKE